MFIEIIAAVACPDKIKLINSMEINNDGKQQRNRSIKEVNV